MLARGGSGAWPTNACSSTKSDVAYAELRRLILSRRPCPGSRLAQYELAASLGMSITPLREAIRRLSSEHLVDLDTHRDVTWRAMSAAEARQLFEVRLSLDPTAAELAAARRTDDDIAAMRSRRRSGCCRSRASGARTRSPRTASSTGRSTAPRTTTS